MRLSSISQLLIVAAGAWLPLAAAADVPPFDDMVAAMDGASLPLVNIDVDVAQLTVDGPYVDAVFTIAERCQDGDSLVSRPINALLKVRGGTSTRYEKKSFALKFVDNDGEKLDVNLLNMRQDNTWILDAMAIDRARMRNRALFDIWNEFSHTPYDTKFDGRNGTVGRMVEVFLNGNYHGLYCLTDKVNRELLGLKKAKLDDETGKLTVRGVLYKGESWSTATISMTSYKNARTDTDHWNGWQLSYPDDYPCLQAWQPLMTFIDFINSDDDVFAANYLDWYHTGNLVDYWILLQQFNILDMPYKNAFVSTVDVTSGSHRYLITPWDMDASMGQGVYGERRDLLTDIHRLTNSNMPYFSLINYDIDSFYAQIARRWKELDATVLSPDHVMDVMHGYARRLDGSGAWARERDRWQDNPVPLADTAADELEYISQWYDRNRALLQPLMLMDANRDWAVDVGDVNTLLQSILDGDTDPALDTNGDGTVDVGDVNSVLAHIITQPETDNP